MKPKREILYFEEDSDDYSESDDDEEEHGISGGVRPSQYIQSGNNASSYQTSADEEANLRLLKTSNGALKL
jgi:hypothetical protein